MNRFFNNHRNITISAWVWLLSACINVCVRVREWQCMCVCVYMCVSVCVCAYVCLSVCVRIYICVCVSVCAYVCVCVCVCAYVCVFVCVYVSMYDYHIAVAHYAIGSVWNCVCVWVSLFLSCQDSQKNSSRAWAMIMRARVRLMCVVFLTYNNRESKSKSSTLVGSLTRTDKLSTVHGGKCMRNTQAQA